MISGRSGGTLGFAWSGSQATGEIFFLGRRRMPWVETLSPIENDGFESIKDACRETAESLRPANGLRLVAPEALRDFVKGR
jgi:hypothetical protein